jgi:hypothetical protein
MGTRAGTFDLVFDLDGNGVVDESDVDEWFKAAGAWHLPSGAPYPRSDVNPSGENTIEDYETLFSNLGTSVSSFSDGS